MLKNLMITLLIISLGLVACADPVKFKKRDNKTDNSTGSGTIDNGSTKDDFFVSETPPRNKF